jgi:hypothetical protein
MANLKYEKTRSTRKVGVEDRPQGKTENVAGFV